MGQRPNRFQFSGYETLAPGFTNEMYLPNKPLEEWNIDELTRALCKQASGSVLACESCENRCRYGKRIVELLQPVEKSEDQTDEQPAEKKDMRGVKSAEMKKRAAEIKYLRIIASGDPKAYLEAHGMETRNNMSKIRNAYKGVTPEEARKRLAEMGAEVEGMQEMPANATETPAEPSAQANPDKSPAECGAPANHVKTAETGSPEPVKPAPAVALKVAALEGKYFAYHCTENGASLVWKGCGLSMRIDDVDELCAEIKAAFEMMGGKTE